VPTLPAGLAMGIFGEALTIAGISFPSIAAVIQAYAQDRDVRILSTPQILTTDNQEASIYVGRNLPFQTRPRPVPPAPKYSTHSNTVMWVKV
jgi:general secretion pathway protein D